MSSEDFEALLFRLLCFLRASEEVRVPGELRSCSEVGLENLVKPLFGLLNPLGIHWK